MDSTIRTADFQYADWFISFLTWLERERGYTAEQIIAVVEKPHNYDDEYQDYKAEVEAEAHTEQPSARERAARA